MQNYTIDPSKKWDYENGFYLTCETNRIGKFINQLEIYKAITHLPGDILEFGVYKGASLVRLLAFRELLETEMSRKITGFDVFGKFPDELELENDRKFVKHFEAAGGFGISKEELEHLLHQKGHNNFELVKGNIFDTLPAYINQHPALRISILHIDVDVYEPSKFILEQLWNRVVRGGIVMLDDYATIEGETRAVDDFFADKAVEFRKPPFSYIPTYIIKTY